MQYCMQLMYFPLLFDGILNSPCIHVFNVIFCFLVGTVVFLDFFSSWVSVADVSDA